MRKLHSGCLWVALVLLACGQGDPPAQAPAGEAAPLGESSAQWAELTRRETLILELDQSLAELAFSVRNIELPDRRTRQLFALVDLVVEDLSPEPATERQLLASVGVVESIAPPGPLQTDLVPIGLRLWRPLLDQVESFDHAKFQIRSGRYLEGDKNFEADVVFSARAVMRTGELVSIEGAPTLRWRQRGGSDSAKRENWRITHWKTGPLRITSVPRSLFRETLEEAVPDAAALQRARTSIHERMMAKDTRAWLGQGEFEKPHKLFFHEAVSQHPSIAVVDIDQDGFDDFYVTTRWDRNQLFRNRGDGTFEEVAAEYGVDVDRYSNASLFADFDNDGDLDLFLGRSLEPSVYLVNEGGHFVDRTAELIDGFVPQMVSSLSASDVDGDGLLDLYVATYAVQIPLEDVAARLPPADYQEFVRRLQQQGSEKSRYLNSSGPPNVLLRNTGHGFEVVADSGALAVFRNTYQATWADFDGDGDGDLYLANDFAMDNLLRNDDGVFVDVTEEMGFHLRAFGMAATWGDYDRDQRPDLYVANMYSKAGDRVTNALTYLDEGFNEAAQGNFLYRNTKDRFELVSGSAEEGRLAVNRAGWAWGSHFFDADNDGFLDLYSLAGFHTAPREVEKVGDT